MLGQMGHFGVYVLQECPRGFGLQKSVQSYELLQSLYW